MPSQVNTTLHKGYKIRQNPVFYVAIAQKGQSAFGYSLQRRRYGASSSSISGNLPTGGLKRLSVLSSFTCETSPYRTAPVPFSTSKSWYMNGWIEMLSPGVSLIWVPAFT